MTFYVILGLSVLVPSRQTDSLCVGGEDFTVTLSACYTVTPVGGDKVSKSL